MNKSCYKYTDEDGTVFIECNSSNTDKTYITKSLTLEDRQCYSEEIKYCPFCGKPLFEFGCSKIFKF